jgi:4-hydroxy-tetrahydrodipicolinate synthase
VGSGALRLYLYHIPPIAQVSISLGLIGRLINAFPDTVVGIKDSSGDWDNTRDLLREFPGFAVFTGSENFLLATLRGGGAGCITATGNVNPAGICGVFENQERANADELQVRATRIRDVFQAFPLIPGLKEQMSRFTEDPDWRIVRPPLIGMAEGVAGIMHERLGQVGFEM